jgi:hypothetical protein
MNGKVLSMQNLPAEECYNLSDERVYSGVWKIGIRTNDFAENGTAIHSPLLVSEGGLTFARYFLKIDRTQDSKANIKFKGSRIRNGNVELPEEGIYVTEIISLSKISR